MTDWPSRGGKPAPDREEGRDYSLITNGKPVMSPPVDKGCPARGIVRDREGRSRVALPGEDAWAKLEPRQPSEDTELGPLPAPYLDMPGLPTWSPCIVCTPLARQGRRPSGEGANRWINPGWSRTAARLGCGAS